MAECCDVSNFCGEKRARLGFKGEIQDISNSKVQPISAMILGSSDLRPKIFTVSTISKIKCSIRLYYTLFFYKNHES